MYFNIIVLFLCLEDSRSKGIEDRGPRRISTLCQFRSLNYVWPHILCLEGAKRSNEVQYLNIMLWW